MFYIFLGFFPRVCRFDIGTGQGSTLFLIIQRNIHTIHRQGGGACGRGVGAFVWRARVGENVHGISIPSIVSFVFLYIQPTNQQEENTNKKNNQYIDFVCPSWILAFFLVVKLMDHNIVAADYNNATTLTDTIKTIHYPFTYLLQRSTLAIALDKWDGELCTYPSNGDLLTSEK